jgi:hypothetical protein
VVPPVVPVAATPVLVPEAERKMSRAERRAIERDQKKAAAKGKKKGGAQALPLSIADAATGLRTKGGPTASQIEVARAVGAGGVPVRTHAICVVYGSLLTDCF